MDKKIYVFFMVSILIIFAGCGGLKQQPTAEEIRDKSIDAMDDVRSYAFDFDMNIDIKAEETTAGISEMEMKMSGNGKVDKNNKKMYTGTAITMLGTTMNTEQYIINNIQYINAPILGWIKNETGEDIWSKDYAQLEAELMRESTVVLRGSEKVDGKDCYLLEIKPNLEKLFDLISRSDLSGASTNAYMENLSEMVKKFEISEWIAQDTFLIHKAYVVMEMESNGRQIDITMTVRMYDYNKPMTIELPEEAKNARDMSSIRTSMTTPSGT